MTNDVGKFTNSKTNHGKDMIYAGNGESLSISHFDDLNMSRSHGKVRLKDVLVVPSLTKNLLFVSKMIYDNPCTIEFNSFSFLIKDPNQKA